MTLPTLRRAAVTLALGLTVSSTADAREPYLGEIMYFSGNFCPRGWTVAEGQLLDISSNSALFSLLGTNFGGDGRTTFGLPDLRGRVVVGPGDGPGLSTHRVGEKGGAESVTLSLAQVPAHEVAVVQSGGEGSGAGEGGEVKNTSVGGGQAHQNMPPYVTIQACIATTGDYPSRG
jgi:microcystin-dependent protein